MMQKSRKIIGSFSIKSGTMPQATVVISQESSPGSTGTKQFHLNGGNGEEVFRTSDPNTFVLGNGDQLKKVSFVELL